MSDSRLVARGDTFVAYPGETSDGRKYIGDAVARGAASVLWEREGFRWSSEWSVKNAPVDDLKRKAGEIASERLWASERAAVDGRRDRHERQDLLQPLDRAGAHAGRPACGVIGTLGSGWPGKLEPLGNTTPDAVWLQGRLRDYTRQRTRAVSMEVSSHGLVQGRVSGVDFDVARAHEPHARSPRLSRHDARVSQREGAALPLADTEMGRAQRG